MSRRPHTEAGHLGILLWEWDWRAERDYLLAELTAQKWQPDATANS